MTQAPVVADEVHMHTIMIVDNEPNDLAMLQQMLDETDYQFLTASTGTEAQALLSDSSVNVATILVDWILPDINGVELLGWMKSQPHLAEVEVVVHSAEFHVKSVERGIDSGAYYYLTKPFEEPQLEAIVRAAISAYELKKRLIRQVRTTEDAFRLLDVGRFRFKSVEEADLLAVHIASACGTPDASMGLRELLVNAVEHGNLGITYDEKSRLLAENRLEAERKRRLASAEYRDRRGELTLQKLPGFVEVTIRDEGPGFDFERFMTMDDERLFDAHGRGVLMASASLELEYLNPGNYVRVRMPIEE